MIVLYGQPAAASSTLRTLLASAAEAPEGGLTLRVLLYSNSPAGEEPEPHQPPFVTFEQGSGNAGLSGAYNAALRLALAEGYPWLLTLDQDTELPVNFVSAMVSAARAVEEQREIAAIVPHLVEGARVLSPAWVRFGRTRALPLRFGGIPHAEVRAYNSGALLRVAAVHALGGFHPHFWLDYLDSWLHHALHRRGMKMYVVAGLVLEHRLSLLSYRERLTPERFRNFLFAESAYRDMYAGSLENFLHTLQLAARLWRQMRRGDAPGIRAATRACLRWRLTKTRKRRLTQWAAEMEREHAPAHAPQPASIL